jgi:hypothetical protein
VITNLFGVDAYVLMKIIPPALLVWAAWPAILRLRTIFDNRFKNKQPAR